MEKPEIYFLIPNHFILEGYVFRRLLLSNYRKVVMFSVWDGKTFLDRRIAYHVFEVHMFKQKVTESGKFAMVERFPNPKEWKRDAFEFYTGEYELAKKKYDQLVAQRTTLFSPWIEGVRHYVMDRPFFEENEQMRLDYEYTIVNSRKRNARMGKKIERIDYKSGLFGKY